jgi:hypothetical protein
MPKAKWFLAASGIEFGTRVRCRVGAAEQQTTARQPATKKHTMYLRGTAAVATSHLTPLNKLFSSRRAPFL